VTPKLTPKIFIAMGDLLR